MAEKLTQSENQPQIRDFDFRISVPSADRIPEGAGLAFEEDPDLRMEAPAVSVEKADRKAAAADYAAAASSALIAAVPGFEDADADEIIPPVPEDAAPEEAYALRVFGGTAARAFRMIMDMAGGACPGTETGYPEAVLSLLREAAEMPFFRELGEDRDSFTRWAGGLFYGTLVRNDGDPLRFDLREELGHAALCGGAEKPFLACECVERAMYFVIRLIREIGKKKIDNIGDLEKLDASRFLPFRGKTLDRLLTVSSGVLAIVRAAGAEAARAGGAIRIRFADTVTMTVACDPGEAYPAGETAEALERYSAAAEAYRADRVFADDIRCIRFTDEQIRILYSLEWNLVQYDMAGTEPEDAMLKAEWLEEWKDDLCATLEDPRADYIIDDEELLYQRIGEEAAKEEKPVWLYAFALELIRFEPYDSPEDDKKYKKLRCRADYLKDVFCEKQEIITKKDIRKMRELCDEYEGRIKGKLDKVLIRYGARALFITVPYGFLISRLVSAGICVVIDRLGLAAHLFTLNECAKLVTLCDCAILGKEPGYLEYTDVCGIFREVKRQEDVLARLIRETGKGKENKDRVRAMKDTKEYLESCAAQLSGLLRRRGFGDTVYVPE